MLNVIVLSHRIFLFHLKLMAHTGDLHYLMLCAIYLAEQTYSRNIICIIADKLLYHAVILISIISN